MLVGILRKTELQINEPRYYKTKIQRETQNNGVHTDHESILIPSIATAMISLKKKYSPKISLLMPMLLL